MVLKSRIFFIFKIDLHLMSIKVEKPTSYKLDTHEVEFGENLISSKYIFHLIFHWKGIYYGLLYHKTCLGNSIGPPKPLKTAKNVNF